MFAVTEMETGFGRESRSIKPTIVVQVLIVCVGLMLWFAAALGSRSTRRPLAGEDE